MTIDLGLKQILIQIRQSFLLFLTVSKLDLSEQSTKVKNYLCIHRYSKLLERENLCVAIINAVTYRDSKIITQESVVEYLDYDPSENQDWHWEDYG